MEIFLQMLSVVAATFAAATPNDHVHFYVLFLKEAKSNYVVQ